MKGILVYSERASVALELLTFAATLDAPVAVALFGEAQAQAETCFAHGATRAYTSADPALARLPDGTVAEALRQIAAQAGADVVLVGSTLRGRAVAARLAQKLGCGCITDVNGLRVEDGRLVATRYALGGNTVSTETLSSAQQVLAVMPQTFEAQAGAGGNGEVSEATLDLTPSPVQVVEVRPKEAGTVDVASAEVLVCVGRGVEKEEDLAMVEALAEALGGVVGCTRPISHDLHWLAEGQMVGISGKMASPRLYVGIGLSGQIQHTVGVMGSKIAVAINKDKNALIFNASDYGIVGDLYDVVPRLVKKLA